jgi:hypothetical protein
MGTMTTMEIIEVLRRWLGNADSVTPDEFRDAVESAADTIEGEFYCR